MNNTVWAVVDKNGKLIKWIAPVAFDPRVGGYSGHPHIVDGNDPANAPHRWQQFVPKKD
jgi:hypothetical protein